MPTSMIVIDALQAPLRAKPSRYPPHLAAQVQGREKRALGDLFGLRNFGVNLVRRPPGAGSSLRHGHSRQDEFVYVLRGEPRLHSDIGVTRMAPGMCAGFRAGSGDAHCLINDTQAEVLFLEFGDRTAGDEIHYPEEDLRAIFVDGQWCFVRKDGTPFADADEGPLP